MQDLERVLRHVVDSGRSMPLTRRFIVCEGVSHTRGTIAPLRHIHRLKTQYKFRLVVDESLSFGVCGERGRGACEAAGLAPADVEIITGALELASSGIQIRRNIHMNTPTNRPRNSVISPSMGTKQDIATHHTPLRTASRDMHPRLLRGFHLSRL